MVEEIKNNAMIIDKILESIFLKEFNTTAHILENDIYVCLWNNVFMNRQECFEHINTHQKGVVQQFVSKRYLESKKIKNGYCDFIIKYDDLFDSLEKYATERFDSFKKPNHPNSFDFEWYTTGEKECPNH